MGAWQALANPGVAGVELVAGSVRVVVGRSEHGRLHVSGRSQAPLAVGVVVAGSVIDPRAAGAAIGAALEGAERGQRSERVILAIDGDDVRTYHATTTFEREDQEAPVSAGEAVRATREAREDAARNARIAASDDPALRGIATAELRGDVCGLLLDGRPLGTLVGHRGRYVEVRTDVALAPLVRSGAATAALDAVRRRGAIVPGIYALGRLIAASGIEDAGLLRITGDLTAGALLRGGRVAATRSFALGREMLASRGAAPSDAAVWARCVLAAFPDDDDVPARWLVAGLPPELAAFPRALAAALAGRRGGQAEIEPLRAGDASLAVGDAALTAEDLVATGAAMLAAEVYG
ncbi:MAG: hypothetical protein NVS9B6_08670 [Candidatus Limnocylindrales bacterium]